MSESTQDEQWREIPGWEGWYEVSDFGRVRSVDRVVECRDGQRQLHRGQMKALPVDPDGRHVVTLRRPGVCRTKNVATFVLLAFVGPRPAGADACHNDGNCGDDRLSNLRWDSRLENILDSVWHGTHSQTAKTHCPRGHELTAPNLRRAMTRDGRRDCLACHRASGNVQYARKTGRPYDFEAWADDHYARIVASAFDSLPRSFALNIPAN